MTTANIIRQSSACDSHEATTIAHSGRPRDARRRRSRSTVFFVQWRNGRRRLFWRRRRPGEVLSAYDASRSEAVRRIVRHAFARAALRSHERIVSAVKTKNRYYTRDHDRFSKVFHRGNERGRTIAALSKVWRAYCIDEFRRRTESLLTVQNVSRRNEKIFCHYGVYYLLFVLRNRRTWFTKLSFVYTTKRNNCLLFVVNCIMCYDVLGVVRFRSFWCFSIRRTSFFFFSRYRKCCEL